MTMSMRAAFIVSILLLMVSVLFAVPASGAIFTVTSDADNETDDSVCTLREAIKAVGGTLTNGDCPATAASGIHRIHFAIPTLGSRTITVDNTLGVFAPINTPVFIDGLTQASVGSTASCINGPLLIVLDGSQLTASSGQGLQFQENADGSRVRGLVINGFGAAVGATNSAGIRISGADNTQISCNFIGTDALGTTADFNQFGIVVAAQSSGNIIGTNGDGLDDAVERNVISGNVGAFPGPARTGIHIRGDGADDNRVAGNFIGPNVNGSGLLGNDVGILVGGPILAESGPERTIIGTNGDGVGDAGERNFIAGHQFFGTQGRGVDIQGVAGTFATADTRVAGNSIGLKPDGTNLPNRTGVFIGPSVLRTIVGTNGDNVSDLLERNVISGNFTGILIDGAPNTWVAGNYVGPAADGTSLVQRVDALGAPIPSTFGNANGITVTASSPLLPTGTLIGTNSDGTSDTLERNVISGNTVGSNTAGILITTPGAQVSGNYIGTTAAGNAALGNGIRGILLRSSGGFNNADNNIIGTNGDGTRDEIEGNVISAHTQEGIWMQALLGTATNNRIAGNFIGTDATGNFALPNNIGVLIQGNGGCSVTADAEGDPVPSGGSGPSGNIIGWQGSFAGGNAVLEERNVISGNTTFGISIDSCANNNRVAGNFIGTTASGNAALPNGGTALRFSSSFNYALDNRVMFNRGFGAFFSTDGFPLNASDGSGTGFDSRDNCMLFNDNPSAPGIEDGATSLNSSPPFTRFQNNWFGDADGPAPGRFGTCDGCVVGGGEEASGPSLDANPSLAAPPANSGCVALTAPSADLVVTKDDFVTSATAGGMLTYTINVQNTGSATATNATVTDDFPTGLTCSWTCAAPVGSTCNAGSGNLADTVTIQNGHTIVYTAVCSVSSSVTGTINNTATAAVSATMIDPVGSNNVAIDSDTVVTEANLSITKNAASATTSPGGTVTYTIVAANAGPSDVVGAAVDDAFPSSLTCTWTCAPLGTGCPAGPIAGDIHALADIPAGTNRTYTATCTVSLAASGTISNTATVTAPAGTTDPDLDNNSDIADVTVAPPLNVTKTFTPMVIASGGTSLLTITINNPSASPITNIDFTDVYPAGLTNTSPPTTDCNGSATNGTSGPNATLTLEDGSLDAAGGDDTCTVTVNVTASTPGDYVNTLPAGSVTSSSSSNLAPVTATLQVQGAPTVAKLFSPDSIISGNTTTLTITLSNAFSVPITNVAFTDTFPTGVTATTTGSQAQCGGTQTTNTNNVQLSGATIPASGTCVVTVTLTSSTVGVHTNTIAAGAVTSNGGSNAAPASDDLAVTPALSVTKSFSPTSIGVSAPSQMTVQITNASGAVASSFSITDNYPSGLVNTTPTSTNASNCGAGSFTIADGGSSFQFTGGSIASGDTCTITVFVTSATAASYDNIILAADVTSSLGGPAAGANATLTVLDRPTVTKAYVPPGIAMGDTSNLTITIGNPNSGAPLTGVAFTDTLVPNVVPTTPGSTSVCGGTLNVTTAPNTISLSGATVAAGGQCVVTVPVTSNVPSSYGNAIAIGDVTTTNAGSNSVGADATLEVFQPVAVEKSFSPTVIAAGATSTMTIKLTNPNLAALTNVDFLDTYPANLTNASAATNGCGGSVITTTNSLELTNGTVPANGNCTITISVTSNIGATYTNTLPAGSVTTDQGDSQSPVSATLTVQAAPTITKAFSPDATNSGSATTLTITLSNSGTTDITNVSFTDNLPSDVDVEATPTTNCGAGVASGVVGTSTVSLANGTIPANSSCTVTVSVISSVQGVHTNTIPAGAITSDGGTNAAPATDDLTVSTPFTVAKVFSPDTLGVNTVSHLTITINSSSESPALNITLNDVYPSGLVNATPHGASTTCAGGTAVATDGGNSLQLTGSASLLLGQSCTVEVNVTSASAGVYLNTLAAGDINSNLGPNDGATVGSVEFLDRPTVTKSYAPAGIPAGGTSTLTITITNPNDSALTGVAFTDTLDTNVVPTTPGATSVCTTGTLTVATSPNTITLAGATVPPNGQCVVNVPVTSNVLGSYTNTIAAGDVSSAEASTNTTPASATLAVLIPPTVTKTFAVETLPTGQSTSVSIVITNPNSAHDLTGVALTDVFPANMTNAAAPNGTGCGVGSTITAPTADSIQLSGGTITPSGTCTITGLVTSNVAASYTNTIAAGDVATTNAGGNTASASDTVAFLAPPTVTKSFAPTSIPVGGTSTLTITVTNPNDFATMNSVGVSDNLPIGLENTTLGSSALCGGTLTQGTNPGNEHFVQLTGATLAPSAVCTITVSITGAVAGSYTNQLPAGSATASNAGANTVGASASIDVNAGLTVTKSFSPDVIPVGTQSTLTITLTNPNAGTVNGIQFTDVYPTGINNAGTPNQSTTCTSGTATVGNNGSNDTLTLSGASLAGGQQCTVTVTVVGTTVGVHSNGIAAGDVTATNASANSSGATGVLTVMSPPTVSSLFTLAQIPSGGTSTFSVTLSNSNTVAITGAAFSNAFPAGVVVAGTPATSTTCGGTVTPALDNLSFAFSGGTIPLSGSCIVSINVTSSTPGVHTNTIAVGAVTTTNAGSNTVQSQAQLEVMAAPTVAKAFNPTTFTIGATTDLTVTLSNSNGSNITGVTFTDVYPSGMTNAAAAPTSNTCGGMVTASVGGNQLQLANGTIPGSGSCAITIPVTSTTPGAQTNTIAAGDVASANAPSNAQPATANVTVVAPPTGTKSFSPQSIIVTGTSTLTIVINNPNPTQMNDVAFTDNYPSGFQNTASPSPTTSCGGAVTANANGTSLGFSGGTIGANGQCTITVLVVGTSMGNHINTIGAGGVTTSNFPASAAAISGTLSVGVLNPAAVTKSFTPSTIPPNETSTLTITLTNNNAQAITGITFTDTYPSGLTNVTPLSASTSCSGGSVSATAGGSSVGLSGASLGAGEQCTVTALVTASALGNYVNTIPAGGITADNASPNASPVTATLAVQLLAGPIVGKSFNPPAVDVGEATLLIITLTNNSNFAITGADFTDVYPTGMTNTDSPNATTTCGGTATAAAGGTSLSLTGGIIPANGSCQVTALVSFSGSGSIENIIPAGGVTSDNAQTNAAGAAALLQVGTPIPALAPLALLALAALLAGVALLVMRR